MPTPWDDTSVIGETAIAESGSSKKAADDAAAITKLRMCLSLIPEQESPGRAEAFQG
jgi:hypothetical protein